MLQSSAISNALPMLSLVVPIYNESEGLNLFFDRVLPVLKAVTEDWEILCIDDGSRDDSLAQLKRLHAEDGRIRYLSFSRNFGKEAALSAGLVHASGQAVIPIDCDLQDPPELIPAMVAKWREGYKVVLATRASRGDDSFAKRTTAHMFYHIIGALTHFPFPKDTGDYRLMDRDVVEVLKRLPERTRFMKGLFAWVGFSTAQVFFERAPRAAGPAKQNYRALWRLAKDGIFSFTTLPLRISTYLGAVISLVSFSYAGYLLARTIVHGADVPGYASIMAAVLCMGGVQLLTVGILGEYIGRIYRESKQRPLFIVEEKSGM